MSKTYTWNRDSTPEETNEILTILDGIEDLNALTNVNVSIEHCGLSGIFTELSRNGSNVRTGPGNEWLVAGLKTRHDPMYVASSVGSLRFTMPDESPAGPSLISTEQTKALDDARETLDQFGSANWKNHLSLVPTFRAAELAEGTIIPDGYRLMGLDRDNDEYLINEAIEKHNIQYIRQYNIQYIRQWDVSTMYLLPMNPSRETE